MVSRDQTVSARGRTSFLRPGARRRYRRSCEHLTILTRLAASLHSSFPFIRAEGRHWCQPGNTVTRNVIDEGCRLIRWDLLCSWQCAARCECQACVCQRHAAALDPCGTLTPACPTSYTYPYTTPFVYLHCSPWRGCLHATGNIVYCKGKRKRRYQFRRDSSR